jgi:hypothetical protein
VPCHVSFITKHSRNIRNDRAWLVLTAYRAPIPQSVSNEVDSAVSVVRFFAPSPSTLLRNDALPLAPRTAYRMNDTVYLRADFAGLTIASARVNALASAYGTGPMVPRYTMDSADIYPSPPAVCRKHELVYKRICSTQDATLHTRLSVNCQ